MLQACASSSHVGNIDAGVGNIDAEVLEQAVLDIF